MLGEVCGEEGVIIEQWTRGGLLFAEVLLECTRTPGWAEQCLRLLGIPLPSVSGIGRMVDRATGLDDTITSWLAAACFETVWTRLPLADGEDTTAHDAALLELLKAKAPGFPWGAKP